MDVKPHIMSFVYFITSELTAQEGNEMKIPAGSTVFAQMVVPAQSFQQALPVLSAAWREHHYDFMDVLGCSRFNMDNWDFEKHPEESIARVLCLKAVKTGKVEYGVVIKSGA
jgi:hypothetical protein